MSNPIAPAWPFLGRRSGAPSRQGLRGWYPGCPSGGAKLWDQSGYNHHGTLTNFAAPYTPMSGWNFNNAGHHDGLWFDGTDDYVDLGDNFGGFTKMTVAVWLYIQAAPDVSGLLPFNIVSKVSDNNTFAGTGFSLYYDNNISFILGGPNVSVAVALAIKTRVHVCATYDGAALILYVNGRSVASTGASGTINAQSGTATRIGKSASAAFNGLFNGTLNDLMIYDRGLHPSEVFALFNGPTRWTSTRFVPSKRYPTYMASVSPPGLSKLAGGRPSLVGSGGLVG